MKFILGSKIGMSQIFDEKGNVVPVTLVSVGPCEVTQVKTNEKDGYQSVQIGFERIEKEKKIKKPMKEKPFRWIKEFKTEEGDYKKGDAVDSTIFQEGDYIKISGISKGKGYQGVVKRWGFKGRHETHGMKHEARTPGSVGCSFPERVTRGRRLAGRMGFGRITVKNLRIVKIDKENNLMAIRGAVPGRRGTLLEIRG